MKTRPPLALGVLVVLSLGAQALFLASPARPGLPLDDAWTHATYARSLAAHGRLTLHPHQPSSAPTSLLWPGLLAALRLVGGGPVLAPALVNLPLQAWLVVLCWLLARDAGLGGRWAFAAAASSALLGSLVWLALSGMEATLFLALGLTAVWARCRGRHLAAGLLAGLLVLARPEGLALPLAFALAELPAWRDRSARPGRWRAWLRLLAPAAVAAAVYLAVQLAAAGRLVPATYAGRRWLAGEPAAVSLSPVALWSQLVGFATAWVAYLFHWVFGTGLLWRLGVPRPEIAGVVLEVVFGLAAAYGLVAVLWSRAGGAERRAASPLRLLVLWTLVHDAAYIVLLPVHGHAGRYQAVHFVLLPLLVALGLERLARRRTDWVRHLGPAAMALWLVLCLGSTLLWRTVYRDGVDHLARVHVACGRHIADRLPPDAVVATTDLGAIAYFARRPILHLGGLVDPETTRALRAGRCVPHIRRRGATHLAVAQHGRADAEPLERLGLLPPAPDRPALAFLDMWVVFPGHYRLHQGATSTATPAIALYRLDRP